MFPALAGRFLTNCATREVLGDTFFNPKIHKSRACSESAQLLRVTHGAVSKAGCGEDAASVPVPRMLSQGDKETQVMFLLLSSSPLPAGLS